MIKDKLMQGNWIITPTGYEQVIDVLCDSVNTITCEGLPYSEIEPIPITPEILEVCGFVKMPYASVKSFFYRLEVEAEQKNYWFNHNGSDEMSIFETFDETSITCTVNTLHQLQNIIHSLTNHELPVTLHN